MGGGHEGPPPPPHHNFAVIAPMIIKFDIGIKLDVYYTLVTKSCDVTTLRNYDVMTCMLADASA